MSSENNQEKTEKATPKRREESRKKGQVAMSKEVPSVAILLFSLGAFFFSGYWMFANITDFMKTILDNVGTTTFNSSSIYRVMIESAGHFFLLLSPLMISVLIAGIAGNILQTGFLFSTQAVSPKFSKLNPVKGIKKIISLKALVELIKSLLKISTVGFIAFIMVKKEISTIPLLIQMSVVDILAFIGKVSFKICFYTCVALIILSILDYLFQRWQHEKDLMMTKQEIKEELKQKDGDPAVKSRIRKAQIDMAQSRMMDAVPQADVIITNPTRLAIALKFVPDEMAAPKVIAKGAGYIAEKIRNVARENNIPIVEEKPLARILYKTIKIDEFISPDLYKAVAEILAYVYKLRGF